MKEFATYLREHDRSDVTIAGYVQDVRLFAGWFAAANGEELTPEAVTPLDVREYRSYLIDVKKQSGATVNRKLAAVRAWLTWAVSEKVIEINPAASIKGIKLGEPDPRWLTRKQTYALLREVQKEEQLAATKARGDAQHPAIVQARRDAAAIALLLHAGLRVGELVDLDVSDVQVSNRKGQVTVRYGKGGKERTIPLNADARQAVKAWLDVRGKEGIRLLVGRQSEPLTERAVQRMVARYGQRAKLEDLTPHVLRHTFGKTLADAQIPLDRVARLMGHSDLNTTKIYTVPSSGDLANAVERVAWSG